MSSGLNDPNQKKKIIGFRFAWNGIREVYKSEKNFRIHLLATALVISSGVLFGVSALEWSVLALICSLVISLEMVNSSVERVLDYLAPEHHPLAGIIKDISAGAVLISSIGAIIIAICIFLPKILRMLS